MTQKTFLIFGYGTLQHTPDMKDSDDRLYGGTFKGDAILDDYMLARINAWGRWAAAVPSPDGYILGEVWEIPMRKLAELDRSEGINQLHPPYQRMELPVRMRETGEVVTVTVYVCDPTDGRVDMNVLTHTWPVAGDGSYWGRRRTHTMLPDREKPIV